MRQRRFWLGWLCLQVVAIVCAGACANPVPQKLEPPKPPVTALAWLPAESQVVAKVTLAPWRNTPVWTIWEESQSKPNSWPTWIDVALVDELAMGGELHSGEAGENRGSFVAAVLGRFGDGYLAKLAARDQTPVEKHGAWTFYNVQDVRWLQTAPGVIVVCSPDRADFVAARATEGGETVKVAERALMHSLAGRLNLAGADLAVLAEDSTGEGKIALEKQGAQLGISPLARDLVRAGLSIDMGSTVALSLAAETPDPESAQRLKAGVDETLSMFSRNMFVTLLGLRPLVDALKSSQEGSHVMVNGALAEADVKALLSKAASMMQVAAQQGRAPRLAP